MYFPIVYQWRVIGNATIHDFPGIRQEHEIFTDGKCESRKGGNTEFNMYNEFVKGIKELYKVNLGTNNEEKLLRAQGAIFLLMRNNEVLKRMLKAEYDNQKEYLPFVLVANNY